MHGTIVRTGRNARAPAAIGEGGRLRNPASGPCEPVPDLLAPIPPRALPGPAAAPGKGRAVGGLASARKGAGQPGTLI